MRLSAGARERGERVELFVRTSCVTPEPADFLPGSYYLHPDTDPVEEVAKLRAWVDDPSAADTPPTEMPLGPAADQDGDGSGEDEGDGVEVLDGEPEDDDEVGADD